MSLRDQARAAAGAEASARLDGETHDVGPTVAGPVEPRNGREAAEALERSLVPALTAARAAVTAARTAPPVESAAAATEPGEGTLGPLRLSAEQYGALLMPLHPNRIRELRNNSHLEAWDVRRTLTRIFGFGGWDLETIELALVREIEHPSTTSGGKPRWTVIYRCQARLTIKNVDGSYGAVFEDAAAGDSQNQPSLGEAHDQAMKTALSQALKRCAVNLGDQFGMSLYNKGGQSAVVLRTLAGPLSGGAPAIDVTQSDKVYGEQEPDDTGLPTAIELRDEALDRSTSIDRLRTIMADVHPERGRHPAMGHAEVENETGDTEKLAALVYRKLQEHLGRSAVTTPEEPA